MTAVEINGENADELNERLYFIGFTCASIAVEGEQLDKFSFARTCFDQLSETDITVKTSSGTVVQGKFQFTKVSSL